MDLDAVSGILARAEEKLAAAGERLLVERLHAVLDESGSSGMARTLDGLLPLIQALLIVLPHAVAAGMSPSVQAAGETLGTAIAERDIPLSAILDEGLRLHDALLLELAGDLRAYDRVLITAVLHISRAMLEVERAVLLSYYKESLARLTSAGTAPEPDDVNVDGDGDGVNRPGAESGGEV